MYNMIFGFEFISRIVGDETFKASGSFSVPGDNTGPSLHHMGELRSEKHGDCGSIYFLAIFIVVEPAFVEE